VPHSKKAISCDFKPTLPSKAVMGGEDFTCSFYGGPPFRYAHAIKDHGNFVNCVRYASDGSRFITVSSDKAGFVYDGTSGAQIGRLAPESAHTGSIYGVAWSPDNTRVVTCSGGESAARWDGCDAAGRGRTSRDREAVSRPCPTA
jgi:WD repeat-containing protein 1 (actin-interacting protein 1)